MAKILYRRIDDARRVVVHIVVSFGLAQHWPLLSWETMLL